MRHIPAILVILILLAGTTGWSSDDTTRLSGENITASLRQVLPEGWSCTLTTEKGKMGHPHGLGEPLFRIDFINQSSTFHWTFPDGGTAESNPTLRLHFHALADKTLVLETIKEEQIYSWDIPIYFAETPEHLIITSPGWINGGNYSEEAKALIAPLEHALKDFFQKQRK